MWGVIIGGGAAWYLRSPDDHDTHYGTRSGVTRTVHALCGVEQGHRTGLKGSVAHPRGPSWRVPVTCLRPPAPDVGGG
jgi:hypothetical protein